MSAAQGLGHQSPVTVQRQQQPLPQQQPAVQGQTAPKPLPAIPTDPQRVTNVFNNHPPHIEISDTPPDLSNHTVTPKPIETLLKSVTAEHDDKVKQLEENKKAVTDVKIKTIAAVVLGIAAAALIVGGIVACIVFPPAGLGALAAVVVVGCIVCALGGGALVWQMMRQLDDAIHTETLNPQQIKDLKENRDRLKGALELLEGPESDKFKSFLESAPKRKNDQGIDTYELKDLDKYVTLYELKKKIDNGTATPEEVTQHETKLAELERDVAKPLPPPPPPPPPPPTPSEEQEYRTRGQRIFQLKNEIDMTCKGLGFRNGLSLPALRNEIEHLEKKNQELMVKKNDNEDAVCTNPQQYKETLELIQLFKGISLKMEELEGLQSAQTKADARLLGPSELGKLEQQISVLKGHLNKIEKQLQPAELLKAPIAEKEKEVKELEEKYVNPSNDAMVNLEKRNAEIEKKLEQQPPPGPSESRILHTQRLENQEMIRKIETQLRKEYSDKVDDARAELKQLKELSKDPNSVPPASYQKAQLEDIQRKLTNKIQGLEEHLTELKAQQLPPENPAAAPVNPVNAAAPVNPTAPANAIAWFNSWKTQPAPTQEPISLAKPGKPDDEGYYHPAVRFDDPQALYAFGTINEKPGTGPQLVTLDGKNGAAGAQVNFGGHAGSIILNKRGHDKENNYLSLLHPEPLKIDGVTYASPMHYLLTQRIEKEGPPMNLETKNKLKEIILNEPNPKKIYELAKGNWATPNRINQNAPHLLRGHHDGDLNLFKGMDIELKTVLYHKFVGDDGKPNELGRKLLATGTTKLYAGNEPGGTEFGMQIANPKTMIGNNKMGQCLMELRTHLSSIPA